MNTLDLGYVNRLAPYKVWTENDRDFFIETDHGNLFKVGFMNDTSIWESGAYFSRFPCKFQKEYVSLHPNQNLKLWQSQYVPYLS